MLLAQSCISPVTSGKNAAAIALKAIAISVAVCALGLTVPAFGKSVNSNAPSTTPPFFGLPIVDGAVVVTDAAYYGVGKEAAEYQRKLVRLVYQLAYQADPSLIEKNPKIFAWVLAESERKKYVHGFLPSSVTRFDDKQSSLLWVAKNEFDAEDVKARMTESLKNALERSRIPDSFDIVDVRYAALGTYDRAASAFPLDVRLNRGDSNSVILVGMLPFVAPLPFAKWTSQISMSVDQGRAYLNERKDNRHGYVAVRLTLSKAEIASKRLELTFTYKSAAYYRDLALTKVDAELPVFEGAFFGAAYSPPAEKRIPFAAIEPDGPFVAFVKANPDAAISDYTWKAAALSRFVYERRIVMDNLRYAALRAKRFGYAALRSFEYPKAEHVEIYKRLVLADKTPTPTQISCPALVEPDGAGGHHAKLHGACQLSPRITDLKPTVWQSYETIKRDGDSFALLENTDSFASILAFPHDGKDADRFTRKLSDDDLKAGPNRVSYEFALDQVRSSLGKSSERPIFAYQAGYVGMKIGDRFVPAAN